LKERYRLGKVGDVEVKQKLVFAINAFLDPIRERRARFENDTAMVNDILAQGTQQARLQAQDTIAQVRAAMGLTNYLYSKTQNTLQSELRNSVPTEGLAFV
jgi:tryptophanyl-tRNA synthetase